MSKKKTKAGRSSRLFDKAIKGTGKAARSAARKGVKAMTDKKPDYESSIEWLARVVTSLPKYLRLFFSLLTDNRVSSKAKVVLVVGVSVLGGQFAFSGVLHYIQMGLSFLVGPLAFLPSILILLLTADICYRLISAEVIDQYEKEIFGEGDSVASDLSRLRDFLGGSYDKLVAWWQDRTQRAESRMEQEGLIVDGELSEDAIQEASEQIVELESSEQLHDEIQKTVKLLNEDGDAAKRAQLVLEEKVEDE